MAIDTRSRRASVLGVGLTAALTLPLADGAVDQPDRQQVSFSYAGISATAAFVFADVAETGLHSLSAQRGLKAVT